MIQLNDIELKVVRLMLKGYSANEIGDKIHLDLKEIERIRKSIYNKMKIKNPTMLMPTLLKNEIKLS